MKIFQVWHAPPKGEAEQIAREKAQREGVEPCRECRREVG